MDVLDWYFDHSLHIAFYDVYMVERCCKEPELLCRYRFDSTRYNALSVIKFNIDSVDLINNNYVTHWAAILFRAKALLI